MSKIMNNQSKIEESMWTSLGYDFISEERILWKMQFYGREQLLSFIVYFVTVT